MKYISIVIFIFCLANAGFSQATIEFTLDKALSYAQANSYEVLAAEISAQDANQERREFVSIGLPKISGKIGYSHFLQLPVSVIPAGTFGPGTPEQRVAFGTPNSLEAGLELTTLLFDGSYLVGLQAQNRILDLADLRTEETRYRVQKQVTKTYLSAVLIDANRKYLEQNIGNIQKLKNETQALYDNGFVEKLDVDRLILSISNLEVELENLNRQEEVILNALKMLTGVPMNNDIAVTSSIEELSSRAPQEWLDATAAFSQRLDWQVINQVIDLNGENTKQFKYGYLPNLVGFASYNQTLQGNNIFNDNTGFIPSSIIGLQLNIPIFDGFARDAQIQRSELTVKKLELDRRQLERSISMEVQNAQINYASAISRLNDRQKNLDLAQDIYRTSQIKYKEGVGSSLEVTQAEQSLFTAQANYVSALYDLSVAKYDLKYALGY